MHKLPPTPVKIQVKLRFHSTEEVLSDPEFRKLIHMCIMKINSNCDEILDKAYQYAEPGTEPKIKRTPLVFLKEKNLFNTNSLIAEQLKIENKTSDLPSSVREYIESIMLPAAKATIRHYIAIDNPQSTKAK